MTRRQLTVAVTACRVLPKPGVRPGERRLKGEERLGTADPFDIRHAAYEELVGRRWTRTCRIDGWTLPQVHDADVACTLLVPLH